MAVTAREYWQERLEISLDENGITATAEQIAAIAADIQSAHENYGQAFYQPESPYPGEIRRLETELKKEREKVVCRDCKGRGQIETFGPHHGSVSQCDRCRGTGKVAR